MIAIQIMQYMMMLMLMLTQPPPAKTPTQLDFPRHHRRCRQHPSSMQ